MHIVLFDEILETHTVHSLARALQSRGHHITQTGKIWHGHQLPEKEKDIARIWNKVREIAEAGPDAVLTFRAATLLPEMISCLKSCGAQTFVWLPDDPVLHHICYRHVVDSYDTMLHCGGEDVLAFYEQRHGRSGVNFPFWTDAEEFPFIYDPAVAEHDLVFLGNCKGEVRANRYKFISSLPLSKRIYGQVQYDPFNLCGGYLKTNHEVAKVLGKSRCALNIPQLFCDYQEHEYDFPELAAMSHFQFPSRVIQYAAVGIPILSQEPRGVPETFPELITFKNRDEFIKKAIELVHDEAHLHNISRATHTRFERSFSAESRAMLLEELITDAETWRQQSIHKRATGFATILPSKEDSKVENNQNQMCIQQSKRHSHELQDLPSIDEQREELRAMNIESHRKWRILYFGFGGKGATDIIESMRRSLCNLGHTVLHIDPKQHPYVLENPPKAISGHGPVYIRLDQIKPLLEHFNPQVIICNAGGLCFSEHSAAVLAKQGILLLGMTLSDPDVQSSMIEHVGRFDFHTTNSVVALEKYHEAGLINTSLLPFGIDRGYILAEVDIHDDDRADVICLGHGINRPERQKTMKLLATKFNVRVYGRGWELPGAKVVKDMDMIRASRGGLVHINFAQTHAGYTNVKCGVFETIGSGSLLCTGRFPEMENYFTYDSEIIGFESEDDLTTQIGKILGDQNRFEILRRRAFQRLVKEHLYEHRWLELFTRIEMEVFEEPRVLSPERSAHLRSTLSTSGKRPRKVIISGFYGARNTGDELILRSIMDNVTAARRDIQFTVAGQDPVGIERDFACASFNRRDDLLADEEMASASAVVLGGGGLWHDYTFASSGGMPGLFSENSISMTGFGKIPLLARMYGRPFHVYGMGAGPLQQANARKFCRFLSEQAQSIVVRDKESQDLLEGISGWRQPVERVADPVYSLDLSRKRVPKVVREIAANHQVLAVNLRPWREDNGGRFHSQIARSLEQIARQYKCALVGVPMQGGESLDTAVLRKTFAMIRIDQPAVVLDWTNRYEELFGVLSVCSGLLAMRLHACLLAHRLHTPVVGIAYDPKVRQHFEELGRRNFALPINAGPDAYTTYLSRVMEGTDGLDEAFKRRLATIEDDARHGIRKLAKRLGESPLVTEVVPLRELPPVATKKSPIAVRPPVASKKSPIAVRPDVNFTEPGIDLTLGTIRGGNLSNPHAEVAFQSKHAPEGIWFNMASSAPLFEDFVEYLFPIEHTDCKGHTVLLRLRSRYFRPRNKGRLAYQLLINERLVLEEDVAFWGETNSVRVTWRRPVESTSFFRIRVVAKQNCENWNWGSAGRLALTHFAHQPYEYEGSYKVQATSPYSQIFPDA